MVSPSGRSQRTGRSTVAHSASFSVPPSSRGHGCHAIGSAPPPAPVVALVLTLALEVSVSLLHANRSNEANTHNLFIHSTLRLIQSSVLRFTTICAALFVARLDPVSRVWELLAGEAWITRRDAGPMGSVRGVLPRCFCASRRARAASEGGASEATVHHQAV